MDEFVRGKLTDWGLSEWIPKFEDEGIDMECLYELDDEEICSLIPNIGPRKKFNKRLKLLKEGQNPTNQETADVSAHEHEAAADNAQVLLSTSDTSVRGKRQLDLQGEGGVPPARKRQREKNAESFSDEIILSDVKNIMRCVHQRLQNEDNTKLNAFLKTKISDLETDKRELVGVFGKTGAGKSSLINAIIGEKNLLPSGSVSACTTVMIKVEANMHNPKYEAEIEFITKEEWRDELWSMYHILQDNAGQQKENDDDYRDTVEKLAAVYGEEWKNISLENRMDNKYFKDIPEFLQSKRKILTCESAEELSARLVKYTRSDSKVGDGEKVTRQYWPLVKCVTVRVPNNDFLQHVTLVDLPGSGDRNKSRDKMWKGIVGSCSTVWIVTDINRAAAEKEPWEILENASSLMGNGGECQHIHFICTKSDLIEDWDDHLAGAVPALVFKRNMEAKKTVIREFSQQRNIKKHFSENCFKVFTVSSKEFLKGKHLKPEETEIPQLQEFLQDLNDCHSETLNYVSGAYGILSLIQGARCRGVANKKAAVCTELEETLRRELDKVKKPMEEAYEAFEKCLDKGVKESKSSCEGNLKSILYPGGTSGRGFHRILRCVVENNGAYKPKRKEGKEININMKLSSCLTDNIDEEFRKTFPNEGKCGPFSGVISMFSLDTEWLIQKYKDVELQLIFLKTEEEKIKTKVNKTIRDRKKIIYSSLTGTIKANMQACYERAAEFRGPDTLNNMRDAIKKHVHDSKNVMFQVAKDVMLTQLKDLKMYILEELEKSLKESIELSLKTDDYSIPDFSAELNMVKRYRDERQTSQGEEMSLTGADPRGPAAALSP
ncbi:nuclear GTPase SLIP-GC isoform X1 [Lates calcarifer]|uniref:Nuclear GTPase SLIP-GC isoform X1 n=1 Tax=Lates calcarifer TaxID=8187 RepID=A0A4W6BZJ6_LATCA|nr:nuclear GTPase SLIP-GC isoform X1 [Lates calcarifer]XP_018536380.1 nuclear GTPase SLIP-GC isoform X1 [Lates calcarifer]XP_050929820.1 nuclear GTPase SLIP-GC isoform X1 [Lates calcarifer]XP_050929821.1 nuclear GTPase SLIP-GC isoform X1 [Lates calcarifer]